MISVWRLAVLLGNSSSGVRSFTSWIASRSFEQGLFLLMLLLAPVMFWLGGRREAKDNLFLETLSTPLGLSQESKRSFAGTYQGWRLWLGFQSHTMGGAGDVTCLTLRVDLEAELPGDFVASPRPWVGFLSAFNARTFEAEDPRLDKRFIFQCDVPTQGRKLMEDEAVREALAPLGAGSTVGFIQKNQVGLTFTKQAPDEAVLRRHIEEVVAVATALRAVLRLGSPPDWDRVPVRP